MNAQPHERDIHRTVNRIRQGWTDPERQWRRVVGEIRRQSLLAMLATVDEPTASMEAAGS